LAVSLFWLGLITSLKIVVAYLIWKYGFTANEAIAFMRICRPGSVVGPQQVSVPVIEDNIILTIISILCTSSNWSGANGLP
jgi:hypothetical protein